jgi:hypothetical protein
MMSKAKILLSVSLLSSPNLAKGRTVANKIINIFNEPNERQDVNESNHEADINLNDTK